MKNTWLTCLLSVLALNSIAFAEDRALDVWLSWQTGQSTQGMLKNVLPTGAVIASPSTSPDYRYHWIRDAALTMDTVRELRIREADGSAEQSRMLTLLWSYAEFSRRNQLTTNPSGPADGLGLGEPKFNLDGSAYGAPWGRPQNDGPALRASTLIRLAHQLLDQGREAEVRERLYNPHQRWSTVIKTDLEFVSHHWRDPSFDLWEEVRGAHFYTRLVQRRALLEGAGLAERLGDGSAARWYRSQARALETEISRHWDSHRQQINATLDRVEGIDYKSSGLDVAVVLGVLHAASRGLPGDSAGDSFFEASDPRVLATVSKIDEAFRRIYPINSRITDSEGLPLGTAIGRYPEDQYSGEANSSQGNPWFLATAALAEHSYRTADELERDRKVTVTAASARFYNRLPALMLLGGVRAGDRLREGRDARFSALVHGLMERGDAYLRRVKYHADSSGELSEQFNRDNGFMQSAEALTWSHAGLLTAAWARRPDLLQGTH
jgi:glucoamylase